MHKVKIFQENGKFVAEHINSFSHSFINTFDTAEARSEYISNLKNHLQWKGEALEEYSE